MNGRLNGVCFDLARSRSRNPRAFSYRVSTMHSAANGFILNYILPKKTSERNSEPKNVNYEIQSRT